MSDAHPAVGTARQSSKVRSSRNVFIEFSVGDSRGRGKAVDGSGSVAQYWPGQRFKLGRVADFKFAPLHLY
jgi:hypothetical protein